MIVFLDTETTGLDPRIHGIIEIAWSVDGGPVKELILPHSELIDDATPIALEVNGYYERGLDKAEVATREQIEGLWDDLKGATLCGANPAFDATMMIGQFGFIPETVPWKYRLLDIEAYASGALGWEGDPVTGLRSLADYLRDTGHDIPEPDHTAAGDVRTLIGCYKAVRELQVKAHASSL